ncbi:hypothetical protein ABE10_00865, partial [Bacillus toyonensis]|nr:hypothetical protein [Bacillus toyonensis]
VAEDLQAVPGHLADDTDAEPWSGERLPSYDRPGNPELATDRADLVLEQGAQRLDEVEVEVVGEPADVVVRLDVGR